MSGRCRRPRRPPGAGEQVLVGLSLPEPEPRTCTGAAGAALLAVDAVVGPQLVLEVEGHVAALRVVVADDVVGAGDHATSASGAEPGVDDLGLQLLPLVRPSGGRRCFELFRERHGGNLTPTASCGGREAVGGAVCAAADAAGRRRTGRHLTDRSRLGHGPDLPRRRRSVPQRDPRLARRAPARRVVRRGVHDDSPRRRRRGTTSGPGSSSRAAGSVRPGPRSTAARD